MTATPHESGGPPRSTPVEQPGPDAAPSSRAGGAWRAWRQWRRTRPFWGGLLVILGGAEILVSEKAPLPIIVHIGLQGLAGYLIPAVMVLCGLLLLFHPVQQTFYSILAILLALGTWVTSNMGGFFVGMLLGVIGGALAFAWQRGRQAPAKRRRWLRPQREPSVGLALIREERPADPLAADDAPQADAQAAHNEPQADARAASPRADAQAADDAPQAGTRPAQGGPATDAGPGGQRDRSGPGENRRGVTAILAVPLAPLVLSVLAGQVSGGVLPGGPAAGQQPAPAVAASPGTAPTPIGSPGPRLTPTPSPAPTVSPGPTVSPAPTASPSTVPSPRPTRTHPRHVATAGAPGARASTTPATLTAGSAVLAGLSFDGVAQVPTAAGPVPMLRFSMASLALSAGTRLLVGGAGHAFLAEAASLDLSGDVVLYTTKISGTLAGHQVTFTPAQPPSGLGRDVTLSDVVVHQPYASTGTLQAHGYQVT